MPTGDVDPISASGTDLVAIGFTGARRSEIRILLGSCTGSVDYECSFQLQARGLQSACWLRTAYNARPKIKHAVNDASHYCDFRQWYNCGCFPVSHTITTLTHCAPAERHHPEVTSDDNRVLWCYDQAIWKSQETRKLLQRRPCGPKVRPRAVSRFLTEFGIAGGEFEG